ncbi:hypothetical protein M5X17_27545 [Paenibacillus alvei]|uniref:DUF4376 domain-containing protein n=1 Tax=Paenibacillus alvei TaxID=44250 RepID=UPI002280ECD9|nr:hypothetical protein [Paenibacillus alvei]MCY9737460.1 hypothetical protein [Paenibacillus alvei]
MAKAKVIKNNVDIERLKAEKIIELNKACEKNITEDHKSKVVLDSTGKSHWYGYDEVDQRNFTTKMVMLNTKRGETEVMWKTNDTGMYQLHTREEFFGVVDELYKKTEKNIYRCAVKKEQVNKATTVEEVFAITWESPLPSGIPQTPVPTMV